MMEKYTLDYDQKCISKEEVKKWVENGPESNLIEKTEGTGKYLSSIKQYETERNGTIKTDKNGRQKTKDQELTTSQIRAIFTKLKEIDAKPGNFEDTKKAELLMMKPLVAYAAGRHNKKGIEVFKDYIINPGIDKIFEATQPDEMNKRFKNFVKLLEAVLAYHKAHGGN